ncbi:MAG: peptidylprolyl isomerase [Gemmataceae bacterium]
MTPSTGKTLLRAVVLVGFIFLVKGCAPKAEPPANSDVRTTQTETNQGGSGRKVEATPVARSGSQEKSSIQRDRMHQAFAEAVRGPDDPPPGDAVRPPDMTVSKKPVYRLLERVKATWDEIRFTSPSGKPIDYRVVVETNQGNIEIALFPEQAPNHVRNFIALAKVGYYDHLFFESIRHDKNENGQQLHLVEAGCPLGTGSTRTGSIGYWLKEEFTKPDKMSHDEGVVGACRGEEPDSAATRFYISLTKATFLDGNYTLFGKVVTGLDVLRKIGQSPVMVDDEGNTRPEKAVEIIRVSVDSQEREQTKSGK